MASFVVQSPATVPANHSGRFSLTLIGTGTTWTGGTTFSVSGVAAVSKVLQIVNSNTYASLVITTGPNTGTLTVSDGILGHRPRGQVSR